MLRVKLIIFYFPTSWTCFFPLVQGKQHDPRCSNANLKPVTPCGATGRLLRLRTDGSVWTGLLSWAFVFLGVRPQLLHCCSQHPLWLPHYQGITEFILENSFLKGTFNLTYQIYLLKIYFFLSPNFIFFFNPVFWYSTSNSIHYCCFSYFITKGSFVPFIIFILCLHCYNTVLKFYSRQDQLTPLNITASLWTTLQLLFICQSVYLSLCFFFSNRIKYKTLI